MSAAVQQTENIAIAGQYLSFSIGGDEYGVDILKVQEIKGWEEVRSLPDTPAYVKGVLDLRGTIVPIIDLRTRFNFSKIDYTPTTVMILLSVETGDREMITGIVVDGVSDVLDVDPSDIRLSPELGSGINIQYIKGMMNKNGRMVILLDVDKLLNPDELGLSGIDH